MYVTKKDNIIIYNPTDIDIILAIAYLIRSLIVGEPYASII